MTVRDKNLVIFTATLALNFAGLLLAWLLLPPLSKFGSVLSFGGFVGSLIALLDWINRGNPESPTPTAEESLSAGLRD
jgi:hypothetical protein